MGESDISLFANEREANLESTVTMIEAVLIDLGHFVNDCRPIRVGSVHAWTIQKGSASIAIDPQIIARSFSRSNGAMPRSPNSEPSSMICVIRPIWALSSRVVVA